jgi:hypothetical protein
MQLQDYSDIPHDDEYDSTFFVSNVFYGTTSTAIPSPWRRLGGWHLESAEKHNSSLKDVVTNHHKATGTNPLLLERNDNANTFAASSSSSSSTNHRQAMFFMAP